jgi:hypothetical protein
MIRDVIWRHPAAAAETVGAWAKSVESASPWDAAEPLRQLGRLKGCHHRDAVQFNVA